MEDVPPALFDVEPSPPLHVSQDVTVRTMWGDEKARVLAVFHDQDGHPMVKLLTNSGDSISVSVARIVR
jgi:hypothetical protein